MRLSLPDNEPVLFHSFSYVVDSPAALVSAVTALLKGADRQFILFQYEPSADLLEISRIDDILTFQLHSFSGDTAPWSLAEAVDAIGSVTMQPLGSAAARPFARALLRALRSTPARLYRAQWMKAYPHSAPHQLERTLAS